MDKVLGRYLNDRLTQAAVALAQLEEKSIELQAAMQTCDDLAIRRRLGTNLKGLASHILRVAAMARVWSECDSDLPGGLPNE